MFASRGSFRDGNYSDLPRMITVDGSEANAVALRGYGEAHGTAIEIRQVKYFTKQFYALAD
jgi:hypothetical protein